MRTTGMIAAAAGLALAPAAFGQYFLGDGTGLQRTGVRESAPRDLREELRLRNAVVTGNATGGRSLQIAAPYADAGEFRAALGTDSLFRFRRDSFGAGMGVGWRGSESIQYQYAFTTGNTRDVSGAVSRLGGGLEDIRPAAPSTSPFRQRPPTYSSSPADEEGSDTIAPRLGTLRSTAAFSSTRSLSPAVVGLRQGRDRVERVTASSLLGVRSDPLVADITTGLLVDPDTAAANARRSGAGPRPTSPAGAGATPATQRQDLAVKTAYDDLVTRMTERFTRDATPTAAPGTTPAQSPDQAPGQAPDATPGARPGSGPIPETPGGLFRPAPTPGTTPGATPGGTAPTPPGAGQTTPSADPLAQPAWVENLRSLRNRLRDRGLVKGDLTRADQADLAADRSARVAGVDRALIDAIRDAGGEIDSFLKGSANPGDLYADHVQNGERLLGEGQYFDAEERFVRALAMRPGDVVSMLGRLHAQIGGGLYMSAAVNLRVLFVDHPELVGVRYRGSTLPSAERLATVKGELAEMLTLSESRRGLPTPEAALLLAYVGFQTGDEPAMARGLGAIAREHAARAAVEGQPAPEPDPLEDLLRGVWLRGEGR
jgi:hypothetical protein